MNTRPLSAVRHPVARVIWHSKNIAGLALVYLMARQAESLIFTIINRLSQ
jgi:hypothetical protein